MAKKTGHIKLKGSTGKKVLAHKSKKTGMFKALKKQEKRADGIKGKKSERINTKRNAKPSTPVSDDFRNFDARMAANKSRRRQSGPNGAAVSRPTFVMAAPTFQFNTKSLQPAPAPREVEGFHGFVSALDAPKDVPLATLTQVGRQSKPIQREYHGSNVFAVLSDSDEEQQQKVQAAPVFLQPATFTFATTKATTTLQPAALEIDPDL